MWQLIFPKDLSADWSFNCIPLVQSFTEPRNLATLGLYGALVYWTLTAAPFSLLSERLKTWASGLGLCKGAENEGSLGFKSVSGGGQKRKGTSAHIKVGSKVENYADDSSGASVGGGGGDGSIGGGDGGGDGGSGGNGGGRNQAVWRARVRLTVVAGLLIGPFFPASNVMVYVGTFIGERLLYFPSIGFCWLLAELLGLLLPSEAAVKLWSKLVKNSGQNWSTSIKHGGSEKVKKAAATAMAAGGDKESPSSSSSSSSQVKLTVLTVLLLLLLGGYSGRTFLRCFDWFDNERLFKSALTVCPNSCKVQVNVGMAALVKGEHEKALGHFR
jgi:hypothetical protein